MANNNDFAEINQRTIYSYVVQKKGLYMSIEGLFLDTPKLKLMFRAFDANLAPGSRTTDSVDIYLPISTFLVLAHDVMNGTLAKKAAKGILKPPYFKHYGAVYHKEKPDKAPESRALKLVDGKGDARFALIASLQEGVVNNGIVVGKQGTTPHTSIFINMPNQDLKEMVLVGKTYIEQFIGLDLKQRMRSIAQHHPRN